MKTKLLASVTLLFLAFLFHLHRKPCLLLKASSTKLMPRLQRRTKKYCSFFMPRGVVGAEK